MIHWKSDGLRLEIRILKKALAAFYTRYKKDAKIMLSTQKRSAKP
jgi:hypothetical protein